MKVVVGMQTLPLGQVKALPCRHADIRAFSAAQSTSLARVCWPSSSSAVSLLLVLAARTDCDFFFCVQGRSVLGVREVLWLYCLLVRPLCEWQILARTTLLSLHRGDANTWLLQVKRVVSYYQFYLQQIVSRY